ncbi:transposase [Fibrisoma montanum]|uniref:Transposase n=1 Tax=Fibrisoma montanum TaxID=2305895 RepID=A0A418M639_9BACT|nr:RNA-guided endonuclease TnpB family protein [Fibrisoma montanum]RIV21380.1 transposase [Fibrisoma montanum]
MMYKRYRYRIYPTKVQAQTLNRHFGAVRYIYNWGLATKKRAWEESKERVSYNDLQRQLPILKKELTWLSDPYSQSLQISLQNLENAYAGFFAGNGYPAFKTKFSKQSLAYCPPPSRSYINFDSSLIQVPKVGPVKCVISQRFEGKLKTVTISRTPTGKYFASCLVEEDINPAAKTEPIESGAVGVDLGIKYFATLSTGETIANPRHLSKSLKALRRASRQHSKKKKGGKNREKSRKKLARIHERVTNQRTDFLHKVTTRLVRENQTVCIEDLNVAGMGKNHKLARHIKDAGFGTFRRMLEYKAGWYGVNVLVIDRFAPSSKQCSCGHKNDALTLKDRVWTCVSCGTTHDRDQLAAKNIVRFAFHPEIVVKTLVGRGAPELTPVETLALAGR